jgi:hypothetical protein
MYAVTATVTDGGGRAGSAEVMVVVYDPRPSIAAGSGHIASPRGALAGSDATGAGRFRFDAEYCPGETGPAPSAAKASFRLGDDFKLTSTSLAWLVITADKRMAARGVGTVHRRTGRYGFVVYAHDADPDRFRLVAWPLASGQVPGDTRTYDNRRGEALDLDDADPQAIAAGAISIRRGRPARGHCGIAAPPKPDRPPAGHKAAPACPKPHRHAKHGHRHWRHVAKHLKHLRYLAGRSHDANGRCRAASADRHRLHRRFHHPVWPFADVRQQARFRGHRNRGRHGRHGGPGWHSGHGRRGWRW